MSTSESFSQTNVPAVQYNQKRNLKKDEDELETNTSQSQTVPPEPIIKFEHDLTDIEIFLLEERTKLPTSHATSPYTLSDFILSYENAFSFNNSCLGISRLQFGEAIEQNSHILLYGIPPSLGFLIQELTTLRFFTHALKGGFVNRGGKCLVDVSRMKDFWINNPHRLSHECGVRDAGFPEHLLSLLRGNHYSMHRDAYFNKNDTPRV